MDLSLTQPALSYGPQQTGPVSLDDLVGNLPAAKKKFFKDQDVAMDAANKALAAAPNPETAPVTVTPPTSATVTPTPASVPVGTGAQPMEDASGQQPPLVPPQAAAPPDSQPPQVAPTGGSLDVSTPQVGGLPHFLPAPSYLNASTDPNTGMPSAGGGSLSKLGKLLTVLRMVGTGAAVGSQGHTFGQGFMLAQQNQDQQIAQQQAAQQHQMNLAMQRAQLKMLPVQQAAMISNTALNQAYLRQRTATSATQADKNTAMSGLADQNTINKAAAAPTKEKWLRSEDPDTGKSEYIRYDKTDPNADENGLVHLPGPPINANASAPHTAVMGTTRFQYDPKNPKADSNGWYPIGDAPVSTLNAPVAPGPTFKPGTPATEMYKAWGSTGGIVKAIVEGRQTLPSGTALRTPYWSDINQKVLQADPEWTEQRAQIRKAFTTGKDGTNIGNLNTAIVHMDALAEAAKALDNGTFQPGNSAWNALKTMFGDDAPTNFEGIRSAYAGEAASALKGQATDPEIAQMKDNIQQKGSPKQLFGYADTMMGIFNQKLDTYRQRYERAIPGDTAYSPVLPQASAVLRKHGITEYAPQQQTPTQQGPPQSGGNYPAGFHPIGAH